VLVSNIMIALSKRNRWSRLLTCIGPKQIGSPCHQSRLDGFHRAMRAILLRIPLFDVSLWVLANLTSRRSDTHWAPPNG
jgi:hypothetical protein